jgi:DNA-binding Xre family transcriptional regulator
MKILLDQIMNEKQLSSRQVSYLTGVPKSTINAIRNGRVPKIDILEQIAKGLDIYLEDLYESEVSRKWDTFFPDVM